MINFTVGPVQSCDAVRRIGGENCPYFRTPEFSEVMLECERLMLKFAGAPEGAHAVSLTTSGTGGMEATVMNVLTPHDRVLVVNGGSFGHRFCELCEVLLEYRKFLSTLSDGDITITVDDFGRRKVSCSGRMN